MLTKEVTVALFSKKTYNVCEMMSMSMDNAGEFFFFCIFFFWPLVEVPPSTLSFYSIPK